MSCNTGVAHGSLGLKTHHMPLTYRLSVTFLDDVKIYPDAI